jgi:hypothetical protein
MNIVGKILDVFLNLAIGALLLPLAQEWVWTMKRELVSSQIKADYVRHASRGEVALPATNSDAIRCWSICFWSLPSCVKVRAASGNEFFYSAQRTTNSANPYNFRLFMETDVNGNRITNAPSI